MGNIRRNAARLMLCKYFNAYGFWCPSYWKYDMRQHVSLDLCCSECMSSSGQTLHYDLAVIETTAFAGFLLAALTSLCGPIIEIALINVEHLYSYSKPSFLGIPAWIGAVYFCGGPAVGNLGRRIWYSLSTATRPDGQSLL